MLDKTIPLKSVDAISAMADAGADQFNNIVNSVKKIVPTFDGEMVQKVKNKMLSNQKSASSEVEAFFTKDQKLLNQYYALRYEVYHNESGLQYNTFESEHDREGRIVVAVEDGKVVGGIRIMFSDECDVLSNEIPGTEFNYQCLAQKYDKRKNLVFSEISGLVVEKHYRDSTVTKKMFEVLFNESKLHGCHYVFAVAMVVACRNYRKILRQLGYDVEIVMKNIWKEKAIYNFAKTFPMYSKLQ